jgi:hypothetical protein
MSPILGIYASSQQATKLGNFYSIATTTVGAGGSSTITFSSISSTYTHLQIRMLSRSDYVSETNDQISLRFNSDSGTNYSVHRLGGDGSISFSNAATSVTAGSAGRTTGSSLASNIFAAEIVDILDYNNTNKYKTVKTLSGWDANGSGMPDFSSSLWRSTSAITTITMTMGTGNFAQYSSIALYGVK